jgi:hypothetical protein
MHNKIASIPSVRHSIPVSLNNRSFCLMSSFSLGDESTTNLRSRSGNFKDLFLPVADSKCDMPKNFYFQDVPEQQVDMAETFISAHAPEVEKQDWYCRVPIKLVGYLKDEQKIGEQGVLLVDGNSNFFLCRNCENQLTLVELKFDKSSWTATSLPWHGDYVLEGPCRFFMACRK